MGISLNFSAYAQTGLAIVGELKKRRPSLIIIAGGSHVSATPEIVLGSTGIDFIIRGEGERPIKEFVEYLKGKREIFDVANLGFKNAEGIHFNRISPNDPLDELAYGCMNDFTPSSYTFEGRPLCVIVSSRGCPFNCSFCSVQATFGTSYRRRKNENILQEMRQRFDEGYRIFDFEDDNLCVDKKLSLALFASIADEFSNENIECLAMNGLSYHTLDEELLVSMKKAGFSRLNLSLATTHSDSKNIYARPLSLEHFELLSWKAFRLGFKITSYQILGLPGEPLETMLDGFAFNLRLPVLLGPSPFYLAPASPIASTFPKQGARELAACRLTTMMPWGNCTRDQIYTLLLGARILNFLKGLEVTDGETLSNLLLKPLQGREELGRQVLLRLFKTKVFNHVLSSGEFVPQPHFDTQLFLNLLKRAEHLTTLTGQKLILN